MSLISPNPSLPNDARDPDGRAEDLAKARESYQYDFSYGGLCFIQSLPWCEQFSASYLAKGAEIQATVSANKLAAKLVNPVEAWVNQSDPRFDPYARWRPLFPLLKAPLVMDSSQNDWCFAWQRLAGPAPVWIKQLESLPKYLPVTDKALPAGLAHTTVQKLLSQGRLFVVDYALFADVQTGTTDGMQKFLWSPVVLFAADPAIKAGLVPIAIQTRGHTGQADTLYTPQDRDWALAKFAAQIADENLQGVLVHMGYCHEIAQRFILAMHRQLATEHPLYILLSPHTEFTLAVNQVAKKSVLNPGGVQDRLLAPVIGQQLSILVETLKTVDIDALDPTIDFARRGVMDPQQLSQYPFRDDGLRVWPAIQEFVRAYVALYYPSDESVAKDVELQAFVREVGASDGGRLPQLMAHFSVNSVDALAALFSRVIYRVSVYHAAINNSNYDWAGFAPNVSTAAFAGLPPRGTPSDDFLPSMLPSRDLSFESISATYQVTQFAENHLGQYPVGHFHDARVEPLVTRFQSALSAIEEQTSTANNARPLVYPYLLPSRITASINA